MVLKISSVGLISMVLLPPIFLLVIKILGFSSDPFGLIFRLVISEAVSLILVLHFKIKARVPLPQT